MAFGKAVDAKARACGTDSRILWPRPLRATSVFAISLRDAAALVPSAATANISLGAESARAGRSGVDRAGRVLRDTGALVLQRPDAIAALKAALRKLADHYEKFSPAADLMAWEDDVRSNLERMGVTA